MLSKISIDLIFVFCFIYHIRVLEGMIIAEYERSKMYS
jgi:hypothetical protein